MVRARARVRVGVEARVRASILKEACALFAVSIRPYAQSCSEVARVRERVFAGSGSCTT